MLKFIKYLIVFLVLNFGGLALGSIWTNPGTSSEWYTTLNQAPWTTQGYVFGLAWTTIGITFSIWGAYVFSNINRGDYETIVYYIESLVLNIIWNPLFFGAKWLGLAGIVIFGLLVTMVLLARNTHKFYGWKPTLLLAPYIIWLAIANSLNWYIILNN